MISQRIARTAATNAKAAPSNGVAMPNWSTSVPPSLSSLNPVAAVSVRKPSRKLNSTAAGIATLDTYAEDGLLTRAASLETYWENALHGLADRPHVVDIRNMGLIGAVELAPIEGQPGKRAFDVFVKAFEAGILIRVTGDIIALSPPLIISEAQIDELIGTLGQVLSEAA